MTGHPPTSAVPAREREQDVRPILTLLLQAAHRSAVVSLMAYLGTLTYLYLGRDLTGPLVITVAASVLGTCSALLALSQTPRLALVNVVAVVGVAVLVVLVQTARSKVIWFVIPADVALCLAIALGTSEARGPAPSREAAGVLRVHLVLLTLSLQLMFVDRIGVIRSAVQDLTQPIPAVPSP